MNNELQIDANDIISDLSSRIAELTRENAVIKAQYNALNKQFQEVPEETEAE